MTIETEKINESTFAAHWLLRHCSKQVRRLLRLHGATDVLAAEVEQLFLHELLTQFKSRYEQPDDASDWLNMELVSEFLTFDSDLSPGESLLCLLQAPVARIDWLKVVEQLRTPPSDWEYAAARVPASVAHRGAIVGVDSLTGKTQEFESLQEAAACGFEIKYINRAIKTNGKYRGMVWGWKAAKAPGDVFNVVRDDDSGADADTDLEDVTELDAIIS